MYVCMYVCMYMYVCIHACMYACVLMFVCMNVCVCVCVCVCLSGCAFVNTCRKARMPVCKVSYYVMDWIVLTSFIDITQHQIL